MMPACIHCRGSGVEIDHARVGRELRAARLRAGLSLRGLARELGWSPSLLSRIEHGTRSLTPDREAEIAAILTGATAK